MNTNIISGKNQKCAQTLIEAVNCFEKSKELMLAARTCEHLVETLYNQTLHTDDEIFEKVTRMVGHTHTDIVINHSGSEDSCTLHETSLR